MAIEMGAWDEVVQGDIIQRPKQPDSSSHHGRRRSSTQNDHAYATIWRANFQRSAALLIVNLERSSVRRLGEYRSMDIFPLLDELRAIAKNGLLFTQDAYDRARYTRLLELASQYYGLALDLPPVEVQQRLRAELGRVTPHVGANAAIFDQHGAILLMQRVDDGGWCLPGGATEVIETPMDTAVREAREETGLEVRAVQLVDVYARPARMEDGLHALVALVYLCEVVSGTLQCSDEGLDLQYWPIAEVPQWHGVHQRHAEAAYSYWLAQQSPHSG